MNDKKSDSNFQTHNYGRRKFQITKRTHSKIKLKLKDSTPLASQLLFHQKEEEPVQLESYKQVPAKDVSEVYNEPLKEEIDKKSESNYESEPKPQPESEPKLEKMESVDPTKTDYIDPASITESNVEAFDLDNKDDILEPHEDIPDREGRRINSSVFDNLYKERENKEINFPDNQPVLWTAGFPLVNKQGNF